MAECTVLSHQMVVFRSFFHSQLQKHFYTDLFARLEQETRAAVPVMDPTQGNSMFLKLLSEVTCQK